MGRPRNKEGERIIYSNGCRLLLERGYADTSYQAIAEACGLSRALVQHYLPKKELLLKWFIEQLLNRMDEKVVSARPNADLYENFALTGQLYFTFLQNDQSRPLALEILSSRDASLAVIEANAAYQHAKALKVPESDEEITDEIIRLIGGAYESIYKRLKEGDPIDPMEEATRIVAGYAALVGENPKDVEKRIGSRFFTEREVAEIIGILYAEFEAIQR